MDLIKAYYKCPAEYEELYSKLFNAPTTKHFDFSIRQFDRQNEYPAFFCYTEEFVLLVEEIYRKHEQLLWLLKSVPPLVLEQFVLISIVDEVRATSDIEGIHSTRREIKEVIDGTKQSARFSSIVGKYKTLLSSEEMNFKTCADIRAFYDEFAHREIAVNNPAHALDGNLFRKVPADIVNSTGKIIHRGVHLESRIVELLDIALQILNDSGIPFFVRIAVFHYFFEYIHPFYDGNGRTARFIVSYFMSRQFHLLIALRLSLSIKRRKKMYYELFKEADSEWNRGDLTPFVTGFTKIISTIFDEIIPPLESKIKQLIKCKERLTELTNDKLTRQIYEILLESSVFFAQGASMEDLIRLTGKSRNTIKTRLDSLPKEHLIKSNGKKIFYKLDMTLFRVALYPGVSENN